MTHIRLTAGMLEIDILPEIGGSIGRFERIGRDRRDPILRGAPAPDSPLDCGCFPLVPFANRIRDGSFRFRGTDVHIAPNMAGDPSPLHGFGWHRPWATEESGPAEARLTHYYEPAEWPWRYRAEQHFTLDPGGLTLRLSCQNLSDAPMPCGLGYHPYFPCGSDTTIETDVARVWTIDEKVLPVAPEPATGRYALDGQPLCGRDLDNGYDGWGGSALFRYPDRDFDVRMSSPSAAFFQLYSPPTGGYVAAEPVGHRNAALNEPETHWAEAGLTVLEPGEAQTLDMRIDIVPR